MVEWHHWLNGREFEQTLETVKDREAWCAAVHAVARSQTWPSDWTTTTILQSTILKPEYWLTNPLRFVLLSTFLFIIKLGLREAHRPVWVTDMASVKSGWKRASDFQAVLLWCSVDVAAFICLFVHSFNKHLLTPMGQMLSYGLSNWIPQQDWESGNIVFFLFKQKNYWSIVDAIFFLYLTKLAQRGYKNSPKETRFIKWGMVMACSSSFYLTLCLALCSLP